tara:strand:- start:295 stop:489 length:195 start_codon:yes stop_codon:yes gene_type:complete
MKHDKKAFKVSLIFSILLFIWIGIMQISIIDNRDYDGDMYEVYLFDTHIGYYLDYTFDYSLTGR